MSVATDDRPKSRTRVGPRAFSLPWTILAVGVVLAALLALPGQTVTTKYVNDLFIFLDGAYRIVGGQVPNRDFHTSLGPLAFYLPALGYALTGRLAAAMPVGMALCVLLLGAIGAHVIASRMRAAIGLPLAIFLLLTAAVPLNPGEGLADLSFAMFYNRLGWAALGLLLVMYLAPREPSRRQAVLDTVCASVLTLFLIYLKVSYGLVAVAFVALIATDRRQWRWAVVTLALCALACLLVELIWRGTASYWADLELAREVSGELPDLQRLLTIVLLNLADVAVYAIFAAILLWAGRSFRDLLFIGFCAVTGILIIEQNFQIFGILTLAAGAAVMAERLADRIAPALGARVRAGLPLLLGMLMLPVVAQYSLVLLLHATLAVSGQGEPMPMTGFDGIRLARLSSEGLFQNFSRYNRSLADGAAVLASLETPVERVVVFDFVGPFTAGLGLQPAKGDSPWYHWGRTLDDRAFPAPEELLADAQIIMEPKWPVEFYTGVGMRRIYAGYLDENFSLAAESGDWRVYVRNDRPSARPASSSATRQTSSAQP